MSAAVTAGQQSRDNQVGARIRQLRTQAGMPLKDFATTIGMTKGYLWKLETGRASLSRHYALLIASLYKVPEDWVLNGQGEMPKPLVTNSPEERASGETLADRIQCIARELAVSEADIWTALAKLKADRAHQHRPPLRGPDAKPG